MGRLVNEAADLRRLDLPAQHFQPQPSTDPVEDGRCHRVHQEGPGYSCCAVPAESAGQEKGQWRAYQEAGEDPDEGAQGETQTGPRRGRVLPDHAPGP